MLIDIDSHRLDASDVLQLQGKVHALLDSFQRLTPYDCEVAISRRYEVVQKGTAEDLSRLHLREEHQVRATLFIDGRVGKCLVALKQPFEPDELVKEIVARTSFSPADPFAGLADVQDLAWDYADLDLFHDWRKACARTEQVVEACKNGMQSTGQRFQTTRIAFSATAQIQAYGNSRGFVGGYRDTLYRLQCLADAGNRGIPPSRGEFRLSRDLPGLGDPQEFGAWVARKASIPVGERRLPVECCAHVFSPAASVLLLDAFIQAVDGQAVSEGRSVLAGQLSRPLFAPEITIHESPRREKAVGSLPFDLQGCAPNSAAFVEGGRLVRYALNVESARRLGLDNTGNATLPYTRARNLAFAPGLASQVELLVRMGQGVLVDEVRLLKLDISTGHFKIRGTGTWVEQGVMQYRLKPFVIEVPLLTLFQQIKAVGNDGDSYPGMIVGASLLIEGLSTRH